MSIVNQSAKKYSFKSVGIQEADFRQNQKTYADNERPIGIKTPLELGKTNDGIFKMHTDGVAQIHDNFRNLLLTNHGDRLGLYDFGANLAELSHELGAEMGDTEAIKRIKKATAKYMPFIELDTFEPLIDHHENEHIAKVGLRITYHIPKLLIKDKKIEVLIYTAG